MITTTYDPEADALYVYLMSRDTKALDTREVAPGVMLDFDGRRARSLASRCQHVGRRDRRRAGLPKPPDKSSLIAP